MSSRFRGALLGCLMATMVFVAGVVIGQNKYGQPKTVVHVVTLKWKAESTAEQRQQVLEGIKAMAAQIPGIKNVWIKTLKVQGPSAQIPFDSAFVMEFADEAALKAYADHPSHKKWEEIYLPIRETSRTHDISN